MLTYAQASKLAGFDNATSAHSGNGAKLQVQKKKAQRPLLGLLSSKT
jgi:hypothetical protein